MIDYKSLFQGIPVGLYCTAPDGRLLDVNPSLIELLHYPDRETLMAVNAARVYFDPDERLRWQQSIEAKDSIRNFETRYRCYDGEIIWLREYARAVRNTLGEIIYYEGSLEDITQRKRAEEQLHRRLSYERLLVDISFQALVTEDLDKLWNACIRMIGQTLDVSRVYIFEHRANTATMDNTFEWLSTGVSSEKQRLQGLMASQIPWWTEQMHLNHIINYSDIEDIPSLTEVTLFRTKAIKSVLAVPLVVEKSYFGFIGLDQEDRYRDWPDEDVNILKTIAQMLSGTIERKRIQNALTSEKERLAVTLGSIMDGVIATDLEGRIVLMNQRAEMITGQNFSGASDLSLNTFFCLTEERKHFQCVTPLDICLKKATPVVSEQSILLTQEGQRKIISYNCAPILDAGKQPVGFVLVFSDITERKKIETQVALSQKMESIGLLAAGIAHEINTPLQYIGDNMTFLKEAFDGLLQGVHPEIQNTLDCSDLPYWLEEIPRAIEQTQEGIQRVSHLVSAMKEFSHPSTKEKMEADINRAIESTVTISRNAWKYVADIDCELDTDLPLVLCVVEEINQVILNLIVNASDAIREKLEHSPNAENLKGKITIQTKELAQAVEITVKDTGSGIPEENLHRIFEPFFTTKAVGKGTGQGLAIAHDIIVNKHGGNIQVESSMGEGTVFRVQLPLSRKS